MVKRFLKSGLTGFYFGVAEDERVGAGDRLERLSEHPDGLRVADVTRLYTTEKTNESLPSKAVSTAVLPQSWRGYFENQLERLQT